MSGQDQDQESPMAIRIPRGWEIPERLVTPEAAAIGRRALLAGAGLGVLGIAAAARAQAGAQSGVQSGAQTASPAAKPSPGAAPVNETYKPGRDITGEKFATTYNNYYEFSESKNLWRDAQAMKLRPWTISIEGMVANPRTIDIDDLFKQVTFEERIYRHRCVETWAMTVPWTGFPLSQLVKIAEPTGGAKYVVFETKQDQSVMSGLGAPFYPWPYIEGLTIDEATNDLAFISTGLYGKPLPPQNGAPLRLTVPWKYGFKSAKAIVKVSFTDKRPATFWEAIQPSEYGFWANVNPAVAHPRWSQASETLLGTNERVPTQIYNGYGEFVAALYEGRKDQKLFM
jgi:sulfoxide reductase catalytic subunit YedY